MVNIIILIALILLNAFFAGSEIALISLNKNKIKAMVDDGNKVASIVYKMIAIPTRLLSTIQIGVTLSGFLNSALASDSFADDLVRVFLSAGLEASPNTLRSISLIAITVLLAFITLILGELVPKRLAMANPEKFAFAVAYPIYFLNKIAAPFVVLISSCTNLVLRVMGIDPNANSQNVTEEEIRLMVATSSAEGSIQDSEKEMINNIFEFDNTTVDEVMTHRTDIEAIRSDAAYEKVLSYMHGIRYTRIPVYEETIDAIIGILYVKDLFNYMTSTKLKDEASFHLKDIIRKPLFVPDSKAIDQLFYEFKAKANHIAVVIDEYGGTAGIVTMEDLMEEIVGEVFDEYDDIPFDYKKIGESTYIVDGSMMLDDLEKVLEMEMPSDEYDTLNGFLIAKLGRLPEKSEEEPIVFENYTFKILVVDDKVIEKVRVEKKFIEEVEKD
ncbi:MAG: hemolysin family protein [Breznakia sp.]